MLRVSVSCIRIYTQKINAEMAGMIFGIKVDKSLLVDTILMLIDSRILQTHTPFFYVKRNRCLDTILVIMVKNAF